MKVKFRGINQDTLLTLLSIGLDVHEINTDFAPGTFQLTVAITKDYSLTVHSDSIIIYDTDDIDSVEVHKSAFSEVTIV